MGSSQVAGGVQARFGRPKVVVEPTGEKAFVCKTRTVARPTLAAKTKTLRGWGTPGGGWDGWKGAAALRVAVVVGRARYAGRTQDFSESRPYSERFRERHVVDLAASLRSQLMHVPLLE